MRNLASRDRRLWWRENGFGRRVFAFGVDGAERLRFGGSPSGWFGTNPLESDRVSFEEQAC